MKFNLDQRHARLELRVLELEDSVASIARIIGTMTEMLDGLNRIAAQYAQTLQVLMPPSIPQAIRPPAYRISSEPGAGCCDGGNCACRAVSDDQE